MDAPDRRQIPEELLPQAQAIWKREAETNKVRVKLHSAQLTIDSLVEVAELLLDMIDPLGVVSSKRVDLEEVKIIARKRIGMARPKKRKLSNGME
tara:strand:- start:379 stop:663 length:285 start_codon:yes stop_codon:yes gene_type:complete